MFNALILAAADTGRDGAADVAATLAARGGLPVETISVAEGDDVAPAIVEHVGDRDGALLVMSTGGIGLLTGVRRSIAGEVLAGLRQPVLLIGPEAHGAVSMGASTLIVGVVDSVDDSGDPPAALTVVESPDPSGTGRDSRQQSARIPPRTVRGEDPAQMA